MESVYMDWCLYTCKMIHLKDTNNWVKIQDIEVVNENHAPIYGEYVDECVVINVNV